MERERERERGKGGNFHKGNVSSGGRGTEGGGGEIRTLQLRPDKRRGKRESAYGKP